MKIYSDASVSDFFKSIFTQFIALIIRNKIYTALQEENEKLEKKQNYMTVPAAIRELEKIEMTRQTDNIYRLDHAVTAKQKKRAIRKKRTKKR